MDHYARKCRSKIHEQPYKKKYGKGVHQLVYTSQSSDSDAMNVGMVIELSGETYNINSMNSDWLVDAEINTKPIKLQLDTGAKCNVMSEETFNKVGLGYKLKVNKTVLKSGR
ncbi:hypothetical protein DPMN_073146 [Dreissena polymorpha]|uniref:Uncharacterized protein n=1 Tax=Dreissena polymorpha TaxID=45954 RepID=A0A9D4BYM0_DREPO|nr:hypothetical protein DPMN_073146 [Dreissena polymorpha]